MLRHRIGNSAKHLRGCNCLNGMLIRNFSMEQQIERGFREPYCLSRCQNKAASLELIYIYSKASMETVKIEIQNIVHAVLIWQIDSIHSVTQLRRVELPAVDDLVLLLVLFLSMPIMNNHWQSPCCCRITRTDFFSIN